MKKLKPKAKKLKPKAKKLKPKAKKLKPEARIAEESPPLLLYSTNTWLAYSIAERYYGGRHFVWCSPYLFPDKSPGAPSAMPPTAIPGKIYYNLHEEVVAGDLHSTSIPRNKIGILQGAKAKRGDGVISAHQKSEITSIVTASSTRDFRPVVFIIPYQKVAHLLEKVPPKERAHPMSVEYRIHALPRTHFDVVELIKQ